MRVPRGLRWPLLAAGSIALLLLAALVLVPLLLDVQRFAPIVVASLRQATGRDVTLGRLALRLLPSPAVSVSPVTLAEGPRYPGREALRIRSLAIRLRLLPLLRGRFEFAGIDVEEPALTLIRDRQGRWNFDDLLDRFRAPTPANAPPGGAPGAGADRFGIARASVRGARVVVYDDAVVPGTRSEARIGPVSAEIRGLGLGGATDLDLEVGLGRSVLAATARWTSGERAGAVDLEVRRSRVQAADLVTLLPWLGVARPPRLAVSGTADLEGRASIPLAGQEAIRFDGSVALSGFSYRDAGLSRAIEGVGGRLIVRGDRAEWDDFSAAVGASRVRGRLEVEDYLHPRVGVDLQSDRIDVNELLQAFAPPAAPTPASGGPAGGPGLLGQVTAKGKLAVAALRFMTFDLSEVRGAMTLKDGVVDLPELAARLYGGSLKGAARLDPFAASPRYRLDGGLDGVDVNALAGAYDPSLKNVLRGTLGGRLQVDAAGGALDALLSSATGSASLRIDKGALTSISVLKQLATLLEAAGGRGIGREETPFDRLQGTFAIGRRRAETNDLTLASPDLDLAAQGEVGLDASLDLQVGARFSADASRGMIGATPALRPLVDKDGRIALHALARGTLAAPKIGLDTKAQTRQLEERKKQDVKEQVRGRLIDLLGGKKDKPQPTPPPPR